MVLDVGWVRFSWAVRSVCALFFFFPGQFFFSSPDVPPDDLCQGRSLLLRCVVPQRWLCCEEVRAALSLPKPFAFFRRLASPACVLPPWVLCWKGDGVPCGRGGGPAAAHRQPFSPSRRAPVLGYSVVTARALLGCPLLSLFL